LGLGLRLKFSSLNFKLLGLILVNTFIFEFEGLDLMFRVDFGGL